MMAYSDGFVATIIGKDGKPVREHNESGQRTARVPFDSEYKIRIKNKTAARALAHVEIDGTAVTTAGKIVLGPGESVDLERFLDALSGGKRFKFARASHPDVQDPTSDDIGLVRVTLEPEWVLPKVNFVTFTTTDVRISPPTTPWYPGKIDVGPVCGNQFVNPQPIGSQCASGDGGFVSCNASDALSAIPKAADLGATIEGSHSSQTFAQSHESFPLLAPVVLEIRLRGPKIDPIQPRPFRIQAQKDGVPLFNGIAMTGCNIYPSDGYIQIAIPSDMVEWKG